MANIILDTPSPATPWALPSWISGPGRPKRLFLTPRLLKNFQANYTNPAFSLVLTRGLFWQPAGENYYALQDALRYLATGNVAYVRTAVAHALAAPYAIYQMGFTCSADAAVFVFDWCYDVLQPAEFTALIAHIEAANTSRCTYISTTGNGNWSPHEATFHGPLIAFVLGTIAIQGEVGATDRNVYLRNIMQNYVLALDENIGDGLHPFYEYQEAYWFIPIVAYEMATDQATGSRLMNGRAEGIARSLMGDGEAGLHMWETR